MKILLISPYFAPYSGVAAVRMSSFAEYLIRKHHNVEVLTLNLDLENKKLLKSKKIDRVYLHEVNKRTGFYMQYREFKKSLQTILKDKSFNIVIISCGPYYTQMLGESVCKKLNVPFIIEYRDLWSARQDYHSGFKVNIRFKLMNIFKRPIIKYSLKNCNAIIAVNNQNREYLEKKNNKLKNKIHVISNGYDDVRLQKIENQMIKIVNVKEKQLKLGIFGKFSYYEPKYLKILFSAIQDLNLLGYDISISHVGEKENYIESLISKNYLYKKIYNCTGMMNYEDGILFLNNNVNAMIQISSHPNAIPTKFFDYVYLNKPLITLSSEMSEMVKLQKAYINSYVCSTDEQIKKVLIEIIDNKLVTLTDNCDVNCYKRSNQFLKYEKVINNCILINNDKQD